jgi:hypothetical protein
VSRGKRGLSYYSFNWLINRVSQASWGYSRALRVHHIFRKQAWTRVKSGLFRPGDGDLMTQVQACLVNAPLDAGLALLRIRSLSLQQALRAIFNTFPELFFGRAGSTTNCFGT